MLELVNVSLITLIILQLAVILGLIYIKVTSKNDIEEQINYILEEIERNPEYLKFIGQGFYTSMSKSLMGKSSGYSRKVKKFRSMIVESMIPNELMDSLPENLRNTLGTAPELLPELLRVIASFKEGGLSGGLNAILQGLADNVNKAGLGQFFNPNATPQSIVQERLEKIQKEKNETGDV